MYDAELTQHNLNGSELRKTFYRTYTPTGKPATTTDP